MNFQECRVYEREREVWGCDKEGGFRNGRWSLYGTSRAIIKWRLGWEMYDENGTRKLVFNKEFKD